MAWSRLGLYNVAMGALGERAIDTLTEDTEPRRFLDEIYTRGGGALRFFLEQASWNFALRTVSIDASSDVSPNFGYSYAFLIPDDMVRLDMISAGETFSDPLWDYEEEAGYWHADIDPLYVRFVSDGADFGADFSLWPESFAIWAGHWLAVQLAPKIKNDLDMERLEAREKRLLKEAKAKDAVRGPARFKPAGLWTRARHGGYSRRDRGKRNTLIG